jgi:hypothetical protein
MMHPAVEIKELPEEYRISIEGDRIMVWNGRNGSGYSIEKLAPFTDDDDDS